MIFNDAIHVQGEEKMVMLKALAPQKKLMTTCVQCMTLSDMLNLLLLYKRPQLGQGMCRHCL
jgi:hypothetical protein